MNQPAEPVAAANGDLTWRAKRNDLCRCVGRAQLECAVRALTVRTVRMKRSAWALAFGAFTGVRMISTPSVRKTSSKAALNPKLAKLADDSLISPPRVLAREAHDHRFELSIKRRPTWHAIAVGPPARDELTVPPQERLRADREG